MGSGTLTTFASDRSQAERWFVACAAHELRGEITLQLALAEATLADPNADRAALREMGKGVVAACERQERLLEAASHPRPERVRTSAAGARRPRRHCRRSPASARSSRTQEHHGAGARTTGDPLLVERLVANLIENAIRHNTPKGRLDVATYTAAGHAIFTIANTGPVIPTGELTRLFQPFQRRSSHEGSSADGVGLGLAIVQAIANAHDAMVNAEARTGGGLRIEIGFPAAAWANRSDAATLVLAAMPKRQRMQVTIERAWRSRNSPEGGDVAGTRPTVIAPPICP
jgi:signal transduction histidine kinase